MTVRTVFCFLLVFSAVVLEIVFAFYGIIFPLLPALVFYIAYACGGKYGCFSAAAGGMLRDFAFGFEIPWSILFLLAAAGTAALWLCYAESKTILSVTLPGAIAELVFVFPVMLIEGGLSLVSVADALSSTILCMIVFAFLFPVLVIAADGIAEKLGIGTYSDAKERFLQKQKD